MVATLLAPRRKNLAFLLAPGNRSRNPLDVLHTQHVQLRFRNRGAIVVREAAPNELAIGLGGGIIEYGDPCRNALMDQIRGFQRASPLDVDRHNDHIRRAGMRIGTNQGPSSRPQQMPSADRHGENEKTQHQQGHDPRPGPSAKPEPGATRRSGLNGSLHQDGRGIESDRD